MTSPDRPTRRARIEALLDHAFPGMGLRPAWLTLVSSVCLVLYVFHGKWREAPAWFIELGRNWSGIELLSFHQAGWSHLAALVLLMVVPLVLCRVFEGWTPADLGLSIRGAKQETLLCLGLWLAFLPVIWFFSETPGFQKAYPRLKAVETSASLFVAFHLYYLVKWTAWEFFFRGFMLFGFEKDLGSKAVLVSTLPFVIMHIGKPEAEMLGSIAAGFILCWIALRSRSIWPGVLLHWLVALSMEFFASSWWR